MAHRYTVSHTVLAALVLLFAACTPPLPPSSQPDNVGDAKARVTAYHDSGAYDRDLAAVAGAATAWLTQHAADAPRPAVVLDIDETSLSNWIEIKANDYGFIREGPCGALPHGPCGWIAWEQRAEAPAIASTLKFYRVAVALHVPVFFVTGRHEAERSYTEQNLRQAGYAGWQALAMEPDTMHVPSAADFKAPARAAIEREGYSIIVNMGDQPSDLAGGHAEKTFLLPDPFYRVP
jgi:predicted secreted acid phosphatase